MKEKGLLLVFICTVLLFSFMVFLFTCNPNGPFGDEKIETDEPELPKSEPDNPIFNMTGLPDIFTITEDIINGDFENDLHGNWTGPHVEIGPEGIYSEKEYGYGIRKKSTLFDGDTANYSGILEDGLSVVPQRSVLKQDVNIAIQEMLRISMDVIITRNYDLSAYGGFMYPLRMNIEFSNGKHFTLKMINTRPGMIKELERTDTVLKIEKGVNTLEKNVLCLNPYLILQDFFYMSREDILSTSILSITFMANVNDDYEIQIDNVHAILEGQAPPEPPLPPDTILSNAIIDHTNYISLPVESQENISPVDNKVINGNFENEFRGNWTGPHVEIGPDGIYSQKGYGYGIRKKSSLFDGNSNNYVAILEDGLGTVTQRSVLKTNTDILVSKNLKLSTDVIIVKNSQLDAYGGFMYPLRISLEFSNGKQYVLKVINTRAGTVKLLEKTDIALKIEKGVETGKKETIILEPYRILKDLGVSDSEIISTHISGIIFTSNVNGDYEVQIDNVTTVDMPEINFFYEKIPGSTNHTPNGTWWGYNANKIIRYNNTVFTFVMENDNVSSGPPNASNPSQFSIYKKVESGAWEKGASFSASVPGNILISSDGVLHAFVFEPVQMEGDNGSYGQLKHYWFPNAQSGDIINYQEEIAVDQGKVNVRVGAAIGSDNTMAVGFGHYYEGAQSEELYSKKSGEQLWQFHLAGINLEHDFYYPYILVGDTGYNMLAIQDDYVAMNEPNIYQMIQYFEYNEQAASWSNKLIADFRNHSVANERSSLLEHTEFYEDSQGRIHIIFRAYLDPQDEYKSTFFHVIKDGSTWESYKLNFDEMDRYLEWVRIIEDNGEIYYFCTAYDAYYIKKADSMLFALLTTSLDIKGVYPYLAAPKGGTDRSSSYIDILLLCGNSDYYPNASNYYIRIEKSELSKL